VWKLNNAKSKFSPGTEPKIWIVIFEQVGDQVKWSNTGTDPDGKPIDRSQTLASDSSACAGSRESGSLDYEGEDATHGR
jgi:hypothetical protein